MIKEIYETKCTGCGRCAYFCPVDIIRMDTFREEVPPCQTACPAGVDVRGYIYSLKLGRLDDAIRFLREALPIPAVTGRVCFHPCETECAREQVDEAVSIKSLERFVADRWLKENIEPIPRQHVKKVAVIGSGPAGLAAAYNLIKLGYPVTVLETMTEPGGMLRVGIPEYRLPRDILDTQINYIRSMGVEFQTGVTIGKDMTIQELKDSGYKAIFIAVGAHMSLKLNIPGEELEGLYYGLDFLRAVNTGEKVEMVGRVVVIGGGNVAIDCARIVLRLGAKNVLVLYHRSREEMSAYQEGIEAAESEGVKISYLTAPTRILGTGDKLNGIECIKVKLSKADASGQRSPIPITGSGFTINVDMVIAAVGQVPDLSFLPAQVTSAEGTVVANPVTLETALPGVFTGGDAVTGPSSVVEAIASGRRAAVNIDCYLRGKDPKTDMEKNMKKVGKLPKEGIEVKARHTAPLLSAVRRIKDFREIRLGFTEETAMMEADRCMTCGSKAYIAYPEDCMTCYTCELKCPYEAIYVHPFKEELPRTFEYREGL